MNKKWGKALLWRGFSILIVLSMLMASGMVSPRVSAQGPLAWIVASEAGDWFWTADFIPGELNAAIFDTEAKGTELWVGTVTADESGFAFVDFPIHAVDLLPGMFIEVSDGTSTKGLVLQAISMDVFDTTVLWDNQERDIVVHAAEGAPLVGMALLSGYRVTLDVEDGGSVSIEALS